MKKELVTIEFRYHDEPTWSQDTGYRNKKVLVGIFDSIEEAVEKGNKVIKILSEYFEVRDNDCFEIHGPVGCPIRLVSNCCYPTNGVIYFAKISQMEVDELPNIISQLFDASRRYMVWHRKIDEINDN